MRWTIPNILTVFRLLAAPCVALVFVIFARPTADWIALALFVGAAITDWFDGYIARGWHLQSRFGTMLDPIADKAMVIIALTVVVALSGLDPLLVVPAAVILFREVFVSGLREFLGADASTLKVTKLAKWKTTVQMVAITLLLLSLGLQEEHASLFYALSSDDYALAMDAGPSGWNYVWWVAQSGWLTGLCGVVCFWLAAVLTAITGIDYFVKALPFLREDGRG
ncbi:CDP-diacylglycerol--glycerol-3-phosphate 3-phosphatidyltransferase [Pseudoruegeria sp. SK021]|uniref:CDP-diacylglycerol--glycerol-3-phosphate 3-phosphatidyltransferase n=1 Tax=Pseudoruegeria sp. SK021 TaxID=1933035 RepID=UPI000A229D7C|nr:CDP-diacylglycerol--glycerol-3-phosphate 3-phosphatidyltransferase [Pseudoruegeria sp. SK021]OSP55717.1 CDP-diacylglycerol--glycerol-3-phosphate 3-phosphatidyltransferase [Pseudoruegeria sp. SK021]